MKKAFIFILIILGAASATFTAVTGEVLSSKSRAEAYYQQGYLYYMEDSYKLAVPEFIKALKYEPGMAKARYWIAKSQYKLGNYRSAINQCDTALKLDPHNKSIASLRKLVEKKLSSQPAGAMAPAKKGKASKTAPVSRQVADKPASPAKPETKLETRSAAAENAAKPAESADTTTNAGGQKLISLDLRNVDISTVLQMLSKETGYSIVGGKDVYGKVTVSLKGVTADEAVDIILKSNGLTYTKNGNVIQVFSSGEPERVEELPGGIYVRTFQINYLGADQLKDTLSQLMPPKTSIFTTQGSKTIVIKGTYTDIKRAEILIRNIDIPPRQVMVEAKIIEVDLTNGTTLGMVHSYTNPNNATETVQTVNLANPPTSNGAIGLYYSVTNQNLTSLVEAYATRTGFNILSSPKVVALNEQQAQIITGSQLGYTVKTISTSGVITESVEFIDVGTKLVITPSIKSDGLIVMQIHPEISEGSIVNGVPQKNSTETTTQLIVKDGQTIIIGGLVRDTSQKVVNGVPFLMDIPLVGALFKNTIITSEKKEVIVLMTPHIVAADQVGEMEEKINSMEKARQDIAPSVPLDLVR